MPNSPTPTSSIHPTPSESHTGSQSSDHGRGRGQAPPGRSRGKSRGGLGKYLRARGRRGYGGRPAEFNKRLVLEGEGPPEDDEEAEQIAAENARKYSRRQLATNADRYEEPEPELGSDGEPIVEPEVDLSTFLEKQKLSDDNPAPSFLPNNDDVEYDEDDIDHDIAPLVTAKGKSASRKGKVEQVEWTPELDALHREKMAADAARDLKARFRAASSRTKQGVATTRLRKPDSTLVEAPPLPLPEGTQPPEPKDPMKEMEDFLDELLK